MKLSCLSDEGASLYGFSELSVSFSSETNYAKDVEEIISAKQLVLYPNPVNDVLFVKNHQILSYEIVDLQGKTVARGDTVSVIDVSFLPAGFYFFNVKTVENGNLMNKIVKL